MVEQQNDTQLNHLVPISRLESETITAALKGLILNSLSAFSIMAGKAIDPAIVEQNATAWAMIIVNGVSVYYYARAYIGRMKATAAIQAKPWKEEIKAIVKKDS